MSCPECESMKAQYLAMHRAVLEFARTLNRIEERRLTKVDEGRPEGASSMLKLRAKIERDAGLSLDDMRWLAAGNE